jgi:hypothetical protein
MRDWLIIYWPEQELRKIQTVLILKTLHDAEVFRYS